MFAESTATFAANLFDDYIECVDISRKYWRRILSLIAHDTLHWSAGGSPGDLGGVCS